MRSRITLAATVAAALAVAAPSAMAQGEDTVTLEKGGATKLSLNKKTKGKLKNADVTVSGKSFGITGGTIDPVDADTADIDHAGKLTLRAKSDEHNAAGKPHIHKLTFKNLNVVLGAKDTLRGKADGKTVTIANLTGGTVVRQGIESTDVNGLVGKLTKAGAKALNKELETKVFKKGMTLGKLSIDAQLAEALIAATGETGLQISPSAAQKLQSAGITAAAVSPATQTAGTGGLPLFHFPIGGGKVDPTTLFGTIEHTGALMLTKGSTSVTLDQPFVEISEAPKLSVSLGALGRQTPADIDLSAATKTPTANGIDLAGAVVKLNAIGAGALNTLFETTVFAAGDVVGTASSGVTFK